MFTDFQDRLTYFGTLDDVVDRYPWPKPIDRRSIQQQLITAAIYDKKILINDGYLVANRHLIGEVVDLDKTLVGNMLSTGTARLFARGGTTDLAAGIARTAEKVKSHRKVMAHKDWWKTRNDLEFLSNYVSHLTVPWPADKNMGEIFHSLLCRVRALEGQRGTLLAAQFFKDFDAIFDIYLTRIAKPYNGARTEWEHSCWLHYKTVEAPDHDTIVEGKAMSDHGDLSGIPLMMNVANEVYHLAYSIGAHCSITAPNTIRGIEKSTVGISTALISAFPDILGPEAVAPSQEISREKLNRMNQLILAVPPALQFEDDFSFITRFNTNGDCRRARTDYLKTLEDFAKNEDPAKNKATFDLAIEARDVFAIELARVMRPAVKPDFTDKLFSQFEKRFISEPLELASGAVFGLAGAVGKLMLGEAFTIGYDHLKTRFMERIIEIGVRAQLKTPGIEHAQAADPEPLARQIGLYVGPLKADGMQEVAKTISAHPDIAPPRPAAGYNPDAQV